MWKPERSPLTALLAAAVLVLAACGGRGNGAPAGKTAAGKPAAAPTGPRVVLPSGKVILVEIARTEAERAQGLMFRESMPRDRGMVFLFPEKGVLPFWMKNCHFPLDLVYTKDGVIVDVLKSLPPCAADPCPSYKPSAEADTVLEVNAGVADAEKAFVGATLVYRDVPGR